MRIIFLGTPDFAVASLKSLVENNFNVVAVVTAPDKPGGRGMKMQQSAVKKYATDQQIPVLQPEKLKDPLFLDALKQYDANIQVVVAFRMLPELVWNMPPLGTVNVHASLLPNYRGAAPINWAIINGEYETGVTTFKLQHEIDTGPILLQSKVLISASETAGILHDKLMDEGAKLLIKTLQGIEDHTLHETPQDLNLNCHHAPKIFTDTCLINWHQPMLKVHNLIRGLSPYPAAFTFLNDKKLKVFAAEKIENNNTGILPGSLSTNNKNFLRYACLDGWIDIKELQLEGKTKMSVEDFLRGNKIILNDSR